MSGSDRDIAPPRPDMPRSGCIIADARTKPRARPRCTVVFMSTKRMGPPVAAGSGIVSPSEVRPGWERQAELAELEDMLRAAIMGTLAEGSSPITIASAQRGDQYSAVVLGGSVDASVMRAFCAHVRGLLDGGSRHLVIDLSRVGRADSRLPALLRRVEATVAARGGVVELTGLTPRALHDMDDNPLARVFALYRTAFEGADPQELAWATVRCPGGLDEVAEPYTPARHRVIIDRAAKHTPGRVGPRPRPTDPPRPEPGPGV